MNNQSVSNTSKLQNGKRFGKAIVMGASIAGLWTARVLSDHFEEVVLLERDHLPEGAEFRSGVPQAHQLHLLLKSGLEQMKNWFPDLYEELISDGAIPFDGINDLDVRIRHRWQQRFPSEYAMLSCSRMLLESNIRRRLKQYPRIHFVEGVDVVGLQGDENRQRVSAVRIKSRGASNDPEAVTVHFADLIVDTLGRRSQSPQWLVELGYSAPKESEVDACLGYVTRFYKLKPNTPFIMIGATPPNDPYTGTVFPQENGTMSVLIAGYNKNYPPNEPGKFEDFAKFLGPEFQEAILGAEPISQPYGYRGTSSRWRHYEQLEHWPERYVVLGDAFCGFNPIYGQGMTVAAKSAVVLGEHIKRNNGSLDGIAQPVLREIGRVTQGAWLLATSADIVWPGTQGGTISNRPMDRFARWYLDKLLDAITFDKKIRLAFNAVQQLIKPIKTIFAPPVFLRVMRHTLLKKHREPVLQDQARSVHAGIDSVRN